MAYKILIGIAAFYGLFRLFRTTDNFARTILIGQAIAIGLTILNNSTVQTIGLVLFMLTLALATVYGLTSKNFTLIKRILIVVPAAWLLVTHFFQFQHYPGAGVLGLTMILPIGAYITLTITDVKCYKNEIGFLTIIAVASVIELARRLEWIAT